jgi:hypothetical protein
VGFVRASTAAAAAIGMLTLWAQASLVLPQQRRALGLAATAAYVAGAAILVSLNVQRNERWFAELYVSALPPPSLDWKAPSARAAFVKRAERLRPALEKSVAEAAAEQKERGDDVDEE